MSTSDTNIKNYSQAGQDLFVLSLPFVNNKKVFIDIGCYKPDIINNTLLLEQHGWEGIAIDIVDYSQSWKIRKTPFILGDAISCDYTKLLEKYNLPQTIDYLSLDIEGKGSRYKALSNIISSGYEFKIITIEHDLYRDGYDLAERQPQRKLLKNLGYFLLCSNVMRKDQPFEDWWVNPKYINEKNYIFYKCENTNYDTILKKANEKFKC